MSSKSDTVIQITEGEINKTKGYVIKKPGNYRLIQDVKWAVQGGGGVDCFAITIEANDVILDGGGHCIAQSGAAQGRRVAVQVAARVQRVCIRDLGVRNCANGALWVRGANRNVTVQRLRTWNCGYCACTELDQRLVPVHIARAFAFAVLFDGGRGRPVTNIELLDCDMYETGWLSQPDAAQHQYAPHACSAILVYEAENVTIRNCSVDGCVSAQTSLGIALVAVSNAVVDDALITDVFAAGAHAEALYTEDVGATITDLKPTAVQGNVNPKHFAQRLQDHGNIAQLMLIGTQTMAMVSINKSTAHFQNVIPQHREYEECLLKEHRWRELRTMERLVSYHSDRKSKTSAMYARWVELFCERVLDVKVRVDAGFANLYTSGEVTLPAHRDAYERWVIGLSFGETRTLEFVADQNDEDVTAFELSAGDVFIFTPQLNHTHQHRMHKETQRKGRRINLTYFITILPQQDANKLLLIPTQITKEESQGLPQQQNIISNIPTLNDVIQQ